MAEDRDKHRSPEWYQAMVDAAGDFALFSLDPNGAIATWNPGARRLFAYEPAEVIGKLAGIIFTPEDQATGAHEREISIASTEGRARDDRWHVRRDGTRFWASGLLMAMRDEAGLVRGFVKIVQDRTTEKRTEEQLRSSEEQFARVFLGNPAAMSVELLENGRYVLANEQFFALTGYWRSEVMGRNGEDLGLWVRPEHRAAIHRQLSENRGMNPVRIAIRRKTGEERDCIATFQSTMVNGQSAVVGTYIDATGLLGHDKR